jgi:hypothetical protein
MTIEPILEIILCFSIWLAQVFLGSLLILGFQRIVAAKWLRNIELSLRFYLKSLGILFLLFLFLFALRGHFYPWTDPNNIRGTFAKNYFKPSFFLLRLLFDFFIFAVLVHCLKKQTRGIGAIILIVILLVGSQFAGDWIMSLNPHWKSTGFGLIFLVSSIVMAYSLAVVQITKKAPETERMDIGSVHFSIIATWTYLAVMQLIVIWSGNLPDESTWYISRLQTSWKYLVLFIAIFQVIIPLFLLLVRKLKASVVATRGFGFASLISQSIFTFLMIEPSLHPKGFSSVLITLIYAALVSVTVWFYSWRLADE